LRGHFCRYLSEYSDKTPVFWGFNNSVTI